MVRTGTMRAIVVDKKATPVSEKSLVEWYERMMDITKNAANGSKETLKIGYNSLNENDVFNLQKNIIVLMRFLKIQKNLIFQ